MEHRVLKLEAFAQDTRDRLTRIETRLEDMATKSDLQLLRVEMRSMNHDMRVEVHSMNHDLKAEMHSMSHDLKVEMQAMEGKLIKWLVGTALAVSASSLSVVSLVLQRATQDLSATAPAVIPSPPGGSSIAQ